MALSEFFDRQREFTPRKSAVKKEAVWRQRGSRYLRNTKRPFRKSDLVRSDPDLNQKILTLITRAYPLIASSFDRHLGRVAVKAFDAWPQETGLSKSLLDLEYTTTDETLGGSLVCRAPYAYFIREGQQGKRKSKNRRLTSGELAIMNKPPRGVDPDAWKQAVVAGSRQVDLVNYAYARAVLNRIQKAQKKRRRPRKGRRVSDELVFTPGNIAAGRIFDDISKALGD